MRAQMDAGERGEAELDETERELKRAEGEKIKLNFGAKPAVLKGEASPTSAKPADVASPPPATTSAEALKDDMQEELRLGKPQVAAADSSATETAPASGKVSLKMGFSAKPKNVFAAAKKNALGGKKAVAIEQPKKMSEAERIMREEMERNSKRGSSGFGAPPQKKPRF